MIEDVGENEKLKKKSDVASDAIQNMENNSEEPIGKQMKKNSKGFEFNFLAPNNFVCTTAVKAYGRKMDVDKALAVLPWMESKGVVADTYLLSSLLFVCAKTKRVAEAENIFWQQMPGRNLTYSVATTNSLMYMYAKLNRPDDALKVYELAKGETEIKLIALSLYCYPLFPLPRALSLIIIS
jgi:pentatricopeptide repeat protein